MSSGPRVRIVHLGVALAFVTSLFFVRLVSAQQEPKCSICADISSIKSSPTTFAVFVRPSVLPKISLPAGIALPDTPFRFSVTVDALGVPCRVEPLDGLDAGLTSLVRSAVYGLRFRKCVDSSGKPACNTGRILVYLRRRGKEDVGELTIPGLLNRGNMTMPTEWAIQFKRDECVGIVRYDDNGNWAPMVSHTPGIELMAYRALTSRAIFNCARLRPRQRYKIRLYRGLTVVKAFSPSVHSPSRRRISMPSPNRVRP